MLKEDFTPGQPISAIPADWFNAVAKILNHLKVEVSKDAMPMIEKPARPGKSNPWKILVPQGGGGGGVLGEFLIPGKIKIVKGGSAASPTWAIKQSWSKIVLAADGIKVSHDVDGPTGSEYASSIPLELHLDEHAEGVIKRKEEEAE